MLKIQKKVQDKINYMNTKIKIISYIFLGVTNIKCQEKKDTNSTIENISKMNENTIEKVLEKQLKQGTTYTIDEAGGGLPKVQFEAEEFEATAQIADKILKSNGLNMLSNVDFNKKIKNVFGRIIDSNSQSNFLYINYRFLLHTRTY